MKALSKDRKRRYASAIALGSATHYEAPGLSSGQKVVDGDLANNRPVQDDGDVLT
jgi:hypothetical protein